MGQLVMQPCMRNCTPCCTPTCRGVDIPAAVATMIPASCGALPASPSQRLIPPSSSAPPAAQAPLLAAIQRDCGSQQTYGTPLLVPIAIPDASMPFNVITFTSTVLALYLGSVANTLLRDAAEVVRGRGVLGSDAGGFLYAHACVR